MTSASAGLLRAVIYTRVSQDKHDRGRSVEEQEADCRRICEQNGWTLIQVVTDNDRSASRFARKERENYPKIIEMVQNQDLDVLVMWEVSRGQRDLADFVRLRDLCADHEVLYSYSGRTYDMTRTDDRFTSGMDALISERYASETRDRVLRAHRSNAIGGRPHGRLLYGYARSYDQRGNFISQYVVEEQAAIIRRIAERVINGETCYKIAQALNDDGVPGPGGTPWHMATIRRVLVNPAYIGKRVFRGVVVGEAAWPEIFSDDEHLALVARLTDPRRRTNKDSALKHLLSGAAQCAVCDAPLRTKQGYTTRAYACVESSHVTIKMGTLEDYVVAVVLERLGRPDALALFQAPKAATEAQAALADLAILNERLAGFALEAAAGRLSPRMLGRLEAELAPQIAAAEIRSRPEVPLPALRDLIKAPDPADFWARLPVAARREVIQRIMTVRVRPAGKGNHHFRPERVEIVFKG